MASGDNVDVIEVVETSFGGGHSGDDLSDRLNDSGDEDDKSTTGERVTFDSSAGQHGSGGAKTPSGMSRNKSERERKIGHRRVGVGGEITYKKIQSTQIMGSIQLGIQHAVGGLASKPERDLLMQDFMTVETTNFPSEGSNHTPAHHFSEFKFKNYAPIAFRYFRDLFGIQPDDFLMSMCSAPLRELSNPGASGSIFYLTEDDEFIIKTVQHKEGEFLQTLLPGYYMNLNQNPRTLLPKFFGLYCYRCNSKNVRLIAMNNLLPSAVKLHQKYDLKGSTYKRKASRSERSKKSPTYKDLDFMEHHPEGIFLEADTYGALVKTIQRDCRVLESFKIMDYSLLVGIHNLDQAAREKTELRLSTTVEEEPGEVGYDSGSFVQVERDKEREDRIGAAALNRSRSINRQRLVAHSTAMESIQAESEPIDEEDDVPPGGIPARNARGERLLLFLGIIDILQSYRLKKKLEHTWKSMIHDGDTVSVHRPGFYAQRFQDFMAKTVFKKIPSPHETTSQKLDLPEIKGNHRKFRNLVTSYIALKHSPSKRKSITRPLRPLDGDFDSTVATAVGSTMHATSPTKAVSPTSPERGTVAPGVLISPTSVPIATSTPVNVPSTGLATSSMEITSGPPPLSVNSSQVRASYPAVLKGRSAASPPNPNLVPSGKVPPPVPPRGTGKRPSIDDAQRGNISSSSSTSGRGDVHVALCLHERFAERKTNSSNPSHVPPPRPSQPQFLPVEYLDVSNYGMSNYPHAYLATLEEDEFVCVEKTNNSYVIKTSPCPIRPERRKQPIHDQVWKPSRELQSNNSGIQQLNRLKSVKPNEGYVMSRKDKKLSETYAERLKQRNLDLSSQLLEASNPNDSRIQQNRLRSVKYNGSYVMSRKDKKHSETYAERMKRNSESKRLKATDTSGFDKKNLNSSMIIKPLSLIGASGDHLDQRFTKVQASTIMQQTQLAPKSLKTRVFDSLFSLKNTSVHTSLNRLMITRSNSINRFGKNGCKPEKLFVMETREFSCVNLRVSSPNVRVEGEILPDTHKSRMSDEEYRSYLTDSSNWGYPSTARNTSFLHGYNY